MIINKTIPPSLGEVVVQPKSQKHTQMSSKMGEKGILSNIKNMTTPEKELKKKKGSYQAYFLRVLKLL